jgi:hypothetical protein
MFMEGSVVLVESAFTLFYPTAGVPFSLSPFLDVSNIGATDEEK